MVNEDWAVILLCISLPSADDGARTPLKIVFSADNRDGAPGIHEPCDEGQQI